MEWAALKFRARPYAVAFGLAAIATAAQAASSAWWSVGAAAPALYMPAIVGGALLGPGPGALAVGVSAVAGLCLRKAGLISPGGRPELGLFGASSVLTMAILGSNWRARAPAADPLFKAVQDISTEGVVVYRVALDPAGQVADFEYRYANPAPCAIMRRRSDDLAGARFLERCRRRAITRSSFRGTCACSKPERSRKPSTSSAGDGF